MSDGNSHLPVLLEEVIDALRIRMQGVYVDGTFGRGGHAFEILKHLGPEGQLLAMDKDPDAVRVAEKIAGLDRRFIIERGSFAMIDRLVKSRGLSGKVDGILLDLGVSSPQLNSSERGFSFQHDGPLDMRMNPDTGIPAAEWLAHAGDREISRVLFEFGEERHARRIARAIVRARTESPIRTTLQLATIVSKANPTHERGRHPATRTFLAIRIFINHELDDLKTGLSKSVRLLKMGGRLVVISFHSLEDRIVKRFIRDQSRGDHLPPDFPVTFDQLNPVLTPVDGPRYPGAEEIAANPRARSAVMRIAERL